MPLIKTFGGFVDFRAGERDSKARETVACNFTTCDNGDGLPAVIESASANENGRFTRAQKEFIEAVSAQFLGSPLYGGHIASVGISKAIYMLPASTK